MKNLHFWGICFFSFFILKGQEKIVREDTHLWLSVNSMLRFSDKWGMMADVHHRRSENGELPSFTLARIGANYYITDKLSVNAGFSIMQSKAPFSLASTANEFRPHTQVLYAHSLGKVRLLSRFRFESRWREDAAVDSYFHQLRYRYLLNITLPVRSSPYFPELVIADEILLQSGDKVVFNPMDQNRFFVGIRQKISKDFSFDVGYMNVFQQQTVGNLYYSFHTFRLFLYWTPDFRKKKTTELHPGIHTD